MKKAVSFSLICIAILYAQDDVPKKKVMLEDVIVTPTRNETSISKYAGSVFVLDEKNLKSHSNVIDSIKMIPGVESGQSMGREIGNNFQIRGFGYQSEDRVIIMQDNIARSPSLFSSMISNFRTDNDILKRVEVIKGASSILHGSGAIGGIVSMQTKDARDYLNPNEYYGAMLGARFESNNMRSARAAVYTKGKEIPYDILLYSKLAKFDDIKLADGGTVDKTYDDEKVRTIFAKSGLDFADNHRISLSYYDYKNSLDTMWQTLWQNPDDGDLFVKGNLKQKDISFDYFYNPLSSLVDFSLKLYRSDASYGRGYDIVNRGKPLSIYYKNEDESYGVNLKNISEFKTWLIDHSVVFGVDYIDRTEDVVWIENKKKKKDNFKSMPADYKDIGIYLHDTMSIDKFDLTLGARFDKFKRSANKSDYDDKRLSPRVALSYEILPNFRLLAGYAESFRAPTPHETSMAGPVNRMYWYVPNPNLKAEIAKEYEIGASYDKWLNDQSRLNIKAMYFNGDIKDMINIITLKDMGVPPGGFSQNYGQYVNIDNAKRKGVEILANYTNQFFGIASSYEHIELKDKSNGKRIRNYADKVMLGVEGYFAYNTTLGFDISHYFKPDLEEKSVKRWGNTYYYADKSFTLVNLKGNVEIENLFSGASLNFGINNVFNDKYINANTSAQDGKHRFVGKGRNAYIDVEVKF